ncbi:MAG: metallophosphoesterase [Pseudomonadales bacterium]
MEPSPDQFNQPVLQIVHVTDWHLWLDVSTIEPKTLRLIKRLQKGGAWLGIFDRNLRETFWWNSQDIAAEMREVGSDWADGLLGHDKHALSLFKEALAELTAKDETWSQVATWLIDTGDLSTYGDEKSLLGGIALLKEFSEIAGAQFHHIHGNHDAWPQAQPMHASHEQIDEHKKKLRDEIFVNDYPWPTPIVQSVSSGKYEIHLNALNTVVHDRSENIRAIGRIDQDQHWRKPPRPNEQFDDLREQARAYSQDGSQPRLRILLTHHPVHEPPHFRYRMTMRLADDRQVAENLAPLPEIESMGPIAHIVLSGHTHELYPPLGALPCGPAECEHPHLGPNQCQLIVGSLCKSDWVSGSLALTRQEVAEEVIHLRRLRTEASRRRARLSRKDLKRLRKLEKELQEIHPQQFQILRFFANAANHRTLKLSRTVYFRQNSSGKFKPMGESEEMLVPF